MARYLLTKPARLTRYTRYHPFTLWAGPLGHPDTLNLVNPRLRHKKNPAPWGPGGRSAGLLRLAVVPRLKGLGGLALAQGIDRLVPQLIEPLNELSLIKLGLGLLL